MKNKKGKWTAEENNILMNILQEFVGKGETKAAAFKKAANLLGRTPSACSYRWNTVLSKRENAASPHVTQQLQLPPPPIFEPSSTNELDLNQVIAYLQQFKEENLRNKQLIKEQEVLKERSRALVKELETKKDEYQMLIQQYEAFAKILNASEVFIRERSIH